MGGDFHPKCPTWARKDKMAKNNQTVDRIQAVWNMIGGDDVVDMLLDGSAHICLSLDGLARVNISKGYCERYRFFEKNENVWLSPTFKELFLDQIPTDIFETPQCAIGYIVLDDDLSTVQALNELPDSYDYQKPERFLAHLACILRADPKATFGHLDSRFGGHERSCNVFFVKVKKKDILVYTVWNGKRWNCFARSYSENLGEIWKKGTRFFSATI